MRALRRAFLGGLAALIVLVLVPATAGATTPTPTDWRSVLVSVAPSSSAVRVEVFEGGEAIRLVVAPGHTVTIPGYSNEPYLRITPDGTVEENRNSPTRWSNRTSTGHAPVPADLPSEPDWVRIGSDGALTWHDHRIHAMSGMGDDTDWTVTFDVDGLPHTARGRLTALPSHAPAIEVLVIVAVAGIVGFVGRRRARVATGASIVAATAIATLLAIGEIVATPPGMDPASVHLVVAVASLALALVGIGLWRTGRRGGTVVAIAAIAVVSWWWVLLLPALTAAIVPSSFTDPVVRIGLALVAGLVVAAAALLVWSGAFAESRDQSTDGVAAA